MTLGPGRGVGSWEEILPLCMDICCWEAEIYVWHTELDCSNFVMPLNWFTAVVITVAVANSNN